jgi:penicillin-binding protein A
VNRQIARLSVTAIVLLAALVVATTYWQTWAVAGLNDRQDNAIQRVAEFSIRRGYIYAQGHTLLARNVIKRVRGKTLYFRRYPHGTLASQLVGYSTQARSRAGLEASLNDYLTGANTNFSTIFRKTVDKLKGTTVTGNNVVLTLKPYAQQVAQNALRGKCGAAVALEPSTGRVLVVASSPTFNANLIENHFDQAAKAGGPCGALVNRAAAGRYVPGSTFKVITATAALDTGKYSPSSTFYDPGYCTEYGKRVYNFADQSGPEQFGTVNFTTALQHSINAVFCDIGKALGPQVILDYAKRFGFYSLPPLETPANERAKSGLYDKRGRLFMPKNAYQVDPGRLAFGQERLQVTPLQMAMVAAGIANHGVVMKPQVVDRITKPGGGIVERRRPQELDRAMKPETAAALTRMMEAVVSGGTGTAAQIPGVTVAGKTGTAETGAPGVNETSFIAFAPAEHPRVAVAVMLERQHGVGGTTAAPIAKTIMQALLGTGSNSG